MKPEECFSIEEIGHDGKAAAIAKGGTAADEREMQRMGKAQELRVCAPCRQLLDALLIVESATSNSYVTGRYRRFALP